jgi:hypothetical protein
MCFASSSNYFNSLNIILTEDGNLIDWIGSDQANLNFKLFLVRLYIICSPIGSDRNILDQVSDFLKISDLIWIGLDEFVELDRILRTLII